jgi:hypothetical protein
VECATTGDMSHGSTLDDDGLLQPISPKELVMLQESVGTLDSAVLTLISAARLAAPLRKQERMLQVDAWIFVRSVMVCKAGHVQVPWTGTPLYNGRI